MNVKLSKLVDTLQNELKRPLSQQEYDFVKYMIKCHIEEKDKKGT